LWTRPKAFMAGKSGELFSGPGKSWFWRERMANYFVDAAKSIYGGKEWRIIFWTRQIMILAGKNGKLFCGCGQQRNLMLAGNSGRKFSGTANLILAGKSGRKYFGSDQS